VDSSAPARRRGSSPGSCPVRQRRRLPLHGRGVDEAGQGAALGAGNGDVAPLHAPVGRCEWGGARGRRGPVAKSGAAALQHVSRVNTQVITVGRRRRRYLRTPRTVMIKEEPRQERCESGMAE
jgi:hypothetical protein